jgi:hypothetical protein
VVGALGVARLLEAAGTSETVVGGIAWERLPIDPLPGPRSVEEIVGARPLADCVVLAGPETRTAGGAAFAEANMARFLGEDTVLVDVTPGPAAVATGLAEAARRLEVDLVACVDVGGDVLANGSEPGLASPLCDAVMLSAAARLPASGLRTVGAVFGPCCDGELTIDELLDRIAELARAGALLGAEGLTEPIVEELERAVEEVPTEASAQALRCARGAFGQTTIRRGRRTVLLSPLGALTFFFDPVKAVDTVARLARAVDDTTSLEEANERLRELGVHTELDYERELTEA